MKRRIPQPALIGADRPRLRAGRARRLVHADPASEREGRGPRRADRGHEQRDLGRSRADPGGEEGRADPRRRPLPPDEGDARPDRHAGDPARAEPGRRGQRHHVRPDHARDDGDADLGLPGDPDHGRVHRELLRPLRLSLPAAEPRRRAPRRARCDRPPVRDRLDRLRGGAAAARASRRSARTSSIDAFVFGTGTAPTVVPPDARDRGDGRHGSDRRHRHDRRDPTTTPTTPAPTDATAAPAGT